MAYVPDITNRCPKNIDPCSLDYVVGWTVKTNLGALGLPTSPRPLKRPKKKQRSKEERRKEKKKKKHGKRDAIQAQAGVPGKKTLRQMANHNCM